jgi:hypothetical protein
MLSLCQSVNSIVETGVTRICMQAPILGLGKCDALRAHAMSRDTEATRTRVSILFALVERGYWYDE